MDQVSIRVFKNSEGIVEHPLEVDGPGSSCSLRLRALPGVSRLHLELLEAGETRLRAELRADGGETVLIQVEREADNRLQVWCPGRNLILLPSDSRFAPTPIHYPFPTSAELDLVLVVDGTCRGFNNGNESVQLLADAALWEKWTDKLCGFVQALASEAENCRVSVVAFGDRKPPHTTAADLEPRYELYPHDSEAHPLQSLDLEHLRAELLAIPPTTGGDFVDALAEALAACRQLRWSPEARKLLLVFGDSPGHSTLYPVPRGGDAQVRELDVDVQVLNLHKAQVELATLYFDPPPDCGLYEIDFARELLEHARRQYLRLAALPELAFVASNFEPTAAATLVGHRTGPVGRYAAPGELLETESISGQDSA